MTINSSDNLPAAFQVRLGPRNDAMSESCVRRTTGPASTGSGSISSQYLSLCIPGKLTATDFGFNLTVFHPKYLIHEGKINRKYKKVANKNSRLIRFFIPQSKS